MVIFQNNNLISIWIGSFSLGFFSSSIFPNTMLLPTTMKMKVDEKVSGKLVAGGTIGEMLIPLLIGFLFNHTSSIILLWVTLFCYIA